MLTSLLQFILVAVILVFSGVKLTKYASSIADHTKIGKFIAGMVLLAAATSIPELSVSVSAAHQGLEDVSIGGLIGSNLFNLLILGILDLAFRSTGRMFSQMSAAHALSAVMSILLTTIVGFSIVAKAPFGIAHVGFGSFLVFFAYLFGMRLVYYNQRIAFLKEQVKQDKSSSQPPPSETSEVSLRHATIGYLVCAAIIIVAAPYLSSSAGTLSKLSGLGDTFIGTTLVALSTSLPELVTTFAALRMGSIDIAVGNIFGSNSFNMLLVSFVDMSYAGNLLNSVSTTHAITCFASILVSAVAVMGQLYHVEKRIAFIEPDAFLIISLVIMSLGFVYYLG